MDEEVPPLVPQVTIANYWSDSDDEIDEEEWAAYQRSLMFTDNNSSFTLKYIIEKEKYSGTNFLEWHRNLGLPFKMAKRHYVLDGPIHFVLSINQQGKVRLTRWYSPYSHNQRSKVIRELSGMILARGPKLCNIHEWRGFKVVYRRYASLYFITCINQDDNELEILEIIQYFVETLNRYFGSVCELELIFHFHKTYYILDEIIIAGELQESSKTTVHRLIDAQDSIVEAAKEKENTVSYIIAQVAN
ncbi:AP-1 complex subunit sigma-2-like [Bidens hawaiensis]|uniref:AP-1 complex subunit sigma-2-like n=1 Tax=Bidens hawaiensis TaxID=980011 RepID=UPI004049BCED